MNRSFFLHGLCFASIFSSVPRYDVFLSFRGEDVRKNLLGHLYSALKQGGFKTYKDDNELTKGCDIAPSLLKAIEQSKIAIIIFSKNYADSKWCLDELVKILDCRDKLGLIVLPIFFHVEPSHVRNQRGSFGKALGRHKKVTVEKVDRWKTALTNAGNVVGFDIRSVNGDESELIKRITEDVRKKLHPIYHAYAKHLSGTEFLVRNIISLLCPKKKENIISVSRLGSKDVRFIGIYGMPRKGKTKIVKVIKVIKDIILSEFDGNCLLEDVQLGSKHGGLVELQKKLLCDILRVRDLHLSDIDDGIDKIRRRLRNKKVLIILHNVDNSRQLDALAKDRSWFGNGSRIIVTCRDEHLLNAHEMDEKHEVPSLNFHYARRLFSWHASRQLSPLNDYADCFHQIVRNAGRQLALKVLGSFLSVKSLPGWTGALKHLKLHSMERC